MSDYLACTKAPPAEVPRQMGLGSCAAPRNHDGPCQYEWMGGKVQIEVGRGPSPMDLVEDLERARRSARRMLRISAACAIANLGLLIYWLGRLT